MPDATRASIESLVKEFNGGASGWKRLHQSRTRFMPIVFGRDGKPQPKKDFRSVDAQDFHDLRASCLRTRTLFEDPVFPADNSSLDFGGGLSLSHIKWLRPSEISPNPVFYEDSYSRFDVNQGELGDCWLLAAAANLTQEPHMFTRVVPEDNSFTVDYAGIFHFTFWRFGHWYDVVIDDRLPTHQGRLVYMRSSEKNEFWSALLEKAYAKLFGSYEALRGGSASEAMIDFTGGISETYDMKEAPKDLFQIIEKGFNNHAMFACSLEPDPQRPEAETAQGLIRGHAYSITMAKMVDIQTPNVKGKIPLLRLRNPWGNATEWNGSWSDQSPEWKYISEETKREIGLIFEVDGEFWISFQDFVKYFDRIEMCNLNPNCPIVQRTAYPWKQSAFEGEWVIGSTAGGCRNFPDTFWHNPQYVVALDNPDKDDDEAKATAIVSLLQKNRRSKQNKGTDCLTIGFIVYRVTERDLVKKPLPKEFFLRNASVARSTYINLREVTCRFRLDPGTYVVIPSTFEPNLEGEFMIRVFSECPNCMRENEDCVGVCDQDPRVAPDTNNSKSVAPIQILDSPDPTKPDPQRKAMERLFIEVAGSDGEIDWMELKMVLDHCFRDDITIAARGITRTYYMPTLESEIKKVKPVPPEAEPVGCGLLDILRNWYINMAGGDNRPAQETSTDLVVSKEKAPLLAADSIGAGFSKDSCRSMVAMLDEDGSGKLGFVEFQKLLTEIARWKAVFKLYDQGKTGHLNPFELRSALQSAGYHLNNNILNSLMHRYGSKEGEIWFDDFITCAVKIKTMIDIFSTKVVDGKNIASFSMDEWIHKTIYS
ncbi:calpain-B-like isoform X2 [Toxorhynchites rutilus septentrionalis]|uniref:calpain-B-like isoform X2 n=1 Tax=Toxorhynchites rutilus septentrionalis TaxID=329112 RepID=UPI0024796668|nr:calpain-B-like isoform X2 [Toxorhynchites rutilus septentrionalis]